MQNKSVKDRGFYSTQLRLLIVILIVLGVFFRFANLDRKIYWHDEAYTSLRISGYTLVEVLKGAFDGRVISIEDFHKYQQPNLEKSVIDTINGLALDEPQHPPLYFILARFWAQWFGSSVAAIRSLSALISLLAFPCIYWLCLELFSSPLTGWIAVALIAVSPFHVLYAQEARDYSLWTVTILLSSAALLRAMRLHAKRSWAVYATTVALGLYSFLLSGLVLIAHGVYVFATERFRLSLRWRAAGGGSGGPLSKKFTAYLLASLAGISAFAPWLLIVITNPARVHNGTSWVTVRTSGLSLAKRWAGNLSRLFLDLDLNSNDSLTSAIPLLIPILFVLILIGYAIYFLYRKSPQRVWLFIFSLVGVPAIALTSQDLIFGGLLSGTARYLIPCFLGVQLTIAYLLATQITSSVNWQQKLWQIVMVVVFSNGVLSCAVSSRAEVWWNKGSYVAEYDPQMAHIINSSTHPLLITNPDGCCDFGYVMSLSYLLDPKVQLQLVLEPNIPDITDNFSDLFLFRPFDALRDGLEKKYKRKAVHRVGELWQLVK